MFLNFFAQNKSFGFPFRMAVFCSIRKPSMSHRKLCESSNLNSASDLGHWNLPLDNRLYNRI